MRGSTKEARHRAPSGEATGTARKRRHPPALRPRSPPPRAAGSGSLVLGHPCRRRAHAEDSFGSRSSGASPISRRTRLEERTHPQPSRVTVPPRNDTLVVHGNPRCGHRSARSGRGRKLAAVGRRKAPRRSCRSRPRSGLRSVRLRRLERAVDPPSTRSSRSEDRCTSAVGSGLAGRPRRTGGARGGHEVHARLRRLAPDDIAVAADALLAGLRHGAALTSVRKRDARS
jgi:hypothetical protein